MTRFSQERIASTCLAARWQSPSSLRWHSSPPNWPGPLCTASERKPGDAFSSFSFACVCRYAYAVTPSFAIVVSILDSNVLGWRRHRECSLAFDCESLIRIVPTLHSDGSQSFYFDQSSVVNNANAVSSRVGFWSVNAKHAELVYKMLLVISNGHRVRVDAVSSAVAFCHHLTDLVARLQMTTVAGGSSTAC